MAQAEPSLRSLGLSEAELWDREGATPRGPRSLLRPGEVRRPPELPRGDGPGLLRRAGSRDEHREAPGTRAEDDAEVHRAGQGVGHGREVQARPRATGKSNVQPPGCKKNR